MIMCIYNNNNIYTHICVQIRIVYIYIYLYIIVCYIIYSIDTYISLTIGSCVHCVYNPCVTYISL